MSADLTLSYATLCGFLLVLTRIAAVFAFVPLPGLRYLPDLPKIAAAVCITFALFPVWPKMAVTHPELSTMARWMASEAAFGITVGVALAFLTEAFILAAQMLGLQAGYSYASTVDPNTQSDSTVLQSMVQLAVGLLFFAAGLHRDVIRVFAASLEAWPPGTFVVGPAMAGSIRQLGAAMFSTALRLAFPVIALMLLVDLSLALLGRINAQLQLLTLAFPLKMLAGLLMLAALMTMFPLVLERSARTTFAAIGGLVH